MTSIQPFGPVLLRRRCLQRPGRPDDCFDEHATKDAPNGGFLWIRLKSSQGMVRVTQNFAWDKHLITFFSLQTLWKHEAIKLVCEFMLLYVVYFRVH